MARERGKRRLSGVRRSLAIAAAGAVALTMAGCGGSSSASSSGQKNVTLSLSSPMSSSWVQLAVAQKQGYFAKEGISVTAQFPGGSGDVMQSLATGRADIGAPTPEAVFAAIDKGQKVKMIYEWTRGPVQSLAVKADSPYHSFADMKGKTIGVSTLSSGAKTLAEADLQLKGLKSSDVNFLAVGTGVAAWDALHRDRVDALMLWDTEYAQMENVGANLRYIRPAETQDLFSTTFVAPDDLISNKPDVVKAFGKAWAEATVWAMANTEQAVREMWDLYPETRTSGEDPAGLMKLDVKIFQERNAVATLGDPGASHTWGKYDPAAVKHWVRFAQQNGITKTLLDPNSTYTNQFVKAYNDFDPSAVQKSAKSTTS